MKTSNMDNLRLICQQLGAKGSEITNAMLYAALGVSKEDQPERDRIRRRCNQMVRYGEMIRIKPGCYLYNKAPRRDAKLYSNAWRAIRSAKPGFCAQQIARISGASYNHICKWFRFLEENGYIKRHGREGNTLLYRATLKSQKANSAPLPPNRNQRFLSVRKNCSQ